MGINIGTTGVDEIYVGEGTLVDDYSAMRGPCPVGFHVPSKDEFDSIITIMTNFGFTTGNSRKEKLFLPFAGWRASSTGDVTSQGTYGRYRASSQYSTQYKTIHHLYLYGNGLRVTNTTSYSGLGRSIRAFKDTPVIPDNVWTTIYAGTGSAGIFHNATLGLISISSDGTNWTTIADKNLGATTVYNSGDTLSESNCGGYFQRGNNYMFPFTGAITTSSTQVDATDYGPGNYYSSSTFITASTWDSSSNPNLRGGETGVQQEQTGNVTEVYVGTTKIRPLKTYQEILDMATTEGKPRTSTIAELNTAPTGYYNLLNNGGYLTTNYIKYFNSQQLPGNYPTIDGITLVTSASSFYIAYSNGTWALGQDTTK